jgi:hypothetical protein
MQRHILLQWVGINTVKNHFILTAQDMAFAILVPGVKGRNL